MIFFFFIFEGKVSWEFSLGAETLCVWFLISNKWSGRIQVLDRTSEVGCYCSVVKINPNGQDCVLCAAHRTCSGALWSVSGISPTEQAMKCLCYWPEPIYYRSSNNNIHLTDRMLQNWPSTLPAMFHLTPNRLMWGFEETELWWEMAFKAILYLSDSVWLSETPDILLNFYCDL